MANILILQHLASEHAGSFRRWIAATGDTATPCLVGEGEPIPGLAAYDAMMVLGGPMHVWEDDRHAFLAAEKAAIRAWLAAGKPYFGICLGHQLLAEALGGTVTRTRPTEIGLSRVHLTDAGRADPVLGGFARFDCLQWHAASVTRVPPGAAVLAENAVCPVQALRHGRAWSVQWHPELDADEIAEWCAIPEFAADCVAELGADALAAMPARLAAALPTIQSDAERLWTAFRAAALASFPPSVKRPHASPSPSGRGPG